MIFRRKQRQNLFVIMSPPRCRSSYVDNLLRSHPDVVCHSELFFKDHPILHLPGLPETDSLHDVKWRDKNAVDYIKRMLAKSQEYAPDARTTGCKLILYPYQMNKGLDALLSFNPRVIFLTRENELAWYSSLKISLETGIWYTKKSLESQHKTTFDINEFSYHTEGRKLYYDYVLTKLQMHKIRYLQVEYESLSRAATIDEILSFLNLSQASLSSEVVEQNTRNILDRFINREEVIKFASSIGKLNWLVSGNFYPTES